MHCIEDKANGVIVNHNGDWSGDVRIAWYVVIDEGQLPRLRECWCNGPDLVAGRFTPSDGRNPAYPLGCEPPINVLTRAVALSVENYLRFKLMRVVDVDLFIRRGKL